MAFYYEAEPSVWKFKERYNWKEFEPKMCRKLERLWRKCEDGDTTVTVVEWKKENQTWKIDVKSLNAVQDSRSTYFRNQVDVSREGYPYPPPGNAKKLDKIFSKYADKDDPDCMDEELVYKFFKDLKLDPEAVGCLILHVMANASGILDFEKKPFKDALSKCGCHSPETIVERIKEIKKKMLQNTPTGVKILKNFAKEVFKLLAESDRQKNLKIIPEEDEDQPVALVVFNMMYVKSGKAIFPLASKFLEFLQQGPEDSMNGGKKVTIMSKDDWMMTSEFLLTNRDEASFSDINDWPLLIEGFMTWCRTGGSEKEMTS